jgi:hypothetical protein
MLGGYISFVAAALDINESSIGLKYEQGSGHEGKSTYVTITLPDNVDKEILGWIATKSGARDEDLSTLHDKKVGDVEN